MAPTRRRVDVDGAGIHHVREGAGPPLVLVHGWPEYQIEVPTRIPWGERDPVVKVEWADRPGECFADYRLDTVPDAGHFVHNERPELANAEIASFFGDDGE